MIGMIVTGHGHFAGGIQSALEVIAGNPSDFAAVEFLEGESSEELEVKMEQAITSLSNCSGILFFTDLAGGSPFKVAVEKSLDKENMEVLAGTNIGMILDIYFARTQLDDVDLLVQKALETGKEQVIHYIYHERKEEIVTSGI